MYLTSLKFALSAHVLPCSFGDPDSVFFLAIRADPHRFIYSSRQLVPHLRHLRHSGTKLAVVSNSMPFFVRTVMQTAFGDDWDSLFDIVVARSLKPGFFSNDPACPFLHPETQAALRLSSCALPMVSGGNDTELLDFMNAKDCAGSRPALFVGDSITHDVIAPSCTGRWHAAAVVEEVMALQPDPMCHPLVLSPDGFPNM
jgi:FMN phosphatase YigB (HAD superfamily)